MKAGDRKVIDAYVRNIGDEMGLKDWTFTILWGEEPEEESTAAQVITIEGRKQALLTLHPDFRHFDLKDIRHYIVHELVHCHTDVMRKQITKDLKDHLAPATLEILKVNFVRNLENAVDGVTDALAKHFPLIKWPA